jgi:hypothetical protein
MVVTATLGPACGARVTDLDGDGGSSVKDDSHSDPSAPDAVAPGVSAFLGDQQNAMKIAVDDQRIYWFESFVESCCVPNAPSTVGVRSCSKNDCRATITTYESLTRDPSLGAGDYYVALAAAGDNVYWAQNTGLDYPSQTIRPPRTIRTCPSTGCVGAPRIIVSSVRFTSMAVDESHVYWTSAEESAVFRLPLSGTGTLEKIALNETNPGQLVLSGSYAYWIERAGAANAAIKRVPKQGGESPVTLAMAQNQATALNVDSEFVYWANAYSLGGILRCPLSGCPNGPEVMIAHQPWIRALAVDGKSIDWISSFDSIPRVQRAAVTRCHIDGCASAVETLAVQDFHTEGMSMVADGSDLYWVAQGLSEPTGAANFPHATIYRYTK